jgi:two-component system, NtrC family, response regulator HydG
MTKAEPKITIVAIDDDRQCLNLVSAALEQEGVEIVTSDDPVQGLGIVRRTQARIVLLDLMMPKMPGMELLERIVDADPSTDVILMTAYYSTESAVEAIRKGACDYLNKPLAIERLQERVGRLIAEARARQKADALDDQLLEAHCFQGMIGRSPLMHEVFARVRRVAPHFRTALVTGRTGTGKELAARALHDLSPVAKGPFVVCNCAALAETLVESELFGYVRGAFTGANQDKTGLFEYAQGGTLLLDEIGEMPLTIQAKLLRAVQQQEVQRLGSPMVRKVNVRIVAATNRDLRSSVAARTFREDLFYRLSMVEIKLPALADRKEDVPLLLRHFVEHFAGQYGKAIEGLTGRAEMVLLRHRWPGNVRELENVIGYGAMMAQSSRIDVHDLPELVANAPAAATEEEGEHPMVSVHEIQKLHARRVLEGVGGDKVMAAQILKVSRATLYRLLAGDAG